MLYWASFFIFFSYLFLLFWGRKQREIEKPKQHKKKGEIEEKETKILLTVEYTPYPLTMETFDWAG